MSTFYENDFLRVSLYDFIDHYLGRNGFVGWYGDSEIVDVREREHMKLVRLYLADGTERVVDPSAQIMVYRVQSPRRWKIF